jgi:ADP-heptose:LPS heptosyltransferase
MGNRNLFRLSRFVLLKVPLLFRFLAKLRPAKNRLLIIKTDAIGDYILFRNYLEVVRKSEKFKGYHITLLGNTLWRDLALNYDSDFVDEFLFISPEPLYHSPLKTLQLGWHIFKNNYAFVLQPSSTRLLITDGLAGLSGAKEIIGFESDNEGIRPKYKAKTDRFYSQTLVLPGAICFEFDRTRFFFESVLGCKIGISSPFISVSKSTEKSIVIFPGAGVAKRGWEREKFLGLIQRIKQQTQAPVYLAGGPGELAISNYLTENIPPGSVINLVGKTSLTQLVELIGKATLVIANETSAVHIAAATQTASVCILGGGHFGRFAPYPQSMEYAPSCLFERMECFNCNWHCIYKTADDEPFPCISAVSIEKVWADVQAVL